MWALILAAIGAGAWLYERNAKSAAAWVPQPVAKDTDPPLLNGAHVLFVVMNSTTGETRTLAGTVTDMAPPVGAPYTVLVAPDHNDNVTGPSTYGFEAGKMVPLGRAFLAMILS